MHLTVEDALALYPLSEGKLTAGRKGLGRIVKSVNVMDAPDITDWVREGDILFTTAYLIKDHPEEGVQLLQKLVNKGAAGIGIKLGRYWTAVPHAMLEEADRIGFPLIELPYPFTFSDQMKGLFNAELQKNNLALKSVLDKQKKLIRFALAKSGAPSDLFEQIGDILGCPLAVTGLNGRVLYSNLSSAELQAAKERTFRPVSQWIRFGSSRLLSVPLHQPGLPDHGLSRVIFKTTHEIPLKEEEGLFHQAAEMITYHLNSVELSGREHAVQDEFAPLLQSYLKQHISSDALAASAERLGIPFGNTPYQCVMISFSPEYALRNEVLMRTVRQELLHHPLLKDLTRLHFQLDEGLFSICPANSPKACSKLSTALHTVFQETAAKAGGSLRICLSHVKPSPAQLLDAYQECIQARSSADRLNLSAFIIEFGSVELSYVFQSVSPAKMRHFIDNSLSPLQVLPPDTGNELLRTLELFIENNGQISETAKQLFVHRNTASYRLEKISELLQIDFKNYNELLKLKLAFLFKDALER